MLLPSCGKVGSFRAAGPCSELAVAAKAIESDPEAYSDAILGQPRSEYIAKLRDPKTWGGALELSICAFRLPPYGPS
jgi:hypothetical protein